MRRLAHALAGLDGAVHAPTRMEQSWRFLVRQRLAAVEQALASAPSGETSTEPEPWLEPRVARLVRERQRLATRTAVLRASVGEAPDVGPLQASLHRLVVDLQHYQQHVNDLVLDTVELDVGGSD